jgi:hypothetical protein
MWATEQESRDRFDAETCERRPADPGDVRFEHGMFEDGMEETPFWLDMIDDTGTIVERHFFATKDEVWSLISSHRYAQNVPFEEEFAPFGPTWQREQAERGGVYH